ncbi:MAG: glycine zipper 2TM domain-containing protein [Stagnimonas sp.]|nr:glycine zipper 2TM domain-containing protein [Stagnimonas sp.]
MNTLEIIPKSKFLVAAALAGFMLVACSPKPETASEVAAQELIDANKKAEEATARADAAQKALDEAQAEQQAALAKTAADAEQADAAAKLKAAETRAANAERESAAAKKRASAAERQVATTSSSAYVEARPAAPVAAPVCQDCGTISAITPITVKGKGTGMGAVAGAIAGIAAGNQVGDGKGTDVAKVVGAIGGAYAGNQAEKYVRRDTVYDVSVRMDTGSTRTVRVDDATSVSTGTRVRVNGANLERL